MKHLYCTLFNERYLGRGLLAYESLLVQDPAMELWVLALDRQTEDFLNVLALPQLRVVGLHAVEVADLLAVKSTRTLGEYCWTLTPHWMQWVMQRNPGEGCTYVDADLYFFNAPDILWGNFWESGRSVFITPHFYTPAVDRSTDCGIYCVQFVSFKPTVVGLQVLADWRAACLDWCFNRIESGRFGDQKYLDNWPGDYPEAIAICQHRGCLGPWNIQQYEVQDLQIFTQDRWVPVVFYHFHGLQWYHTGVDLSEYRLSDGAKRQIYAPYIDVFLNLEQRLRQAQGLPFLPDRQWQKPSMWAGIKRRLRRNYQVWSAPIGTLCKI